MDGNDRLHGTLTNTKLDQLFYEISFLPRK